MQSLRGPTRTFGPDLAGILRETVAISVTRTLCPDIPLEKIALWSDWNPAETFWKQT